MNVHQLIKLSFILTTIALVSFVFYTANFYHGVYFAVRDLQLSIQFDVDVANATTARMTTVVTVQNPSSYSFKVTEAHEALYLCESGRPPRRDDFILATSQTSLPQVTSHSTLSMQFVAYVPERKMSLVLQPGEKMWHLYTRLTLIGPLVGLFRLSDYKYISS